MMEISDYTYKREHVHNMGYDNHFFIASSTVCARTSIHCIDTIPNRQSLVFRVCSVVTRQSAVICSKTDWHTSTLVARL